jgi:hypothetical protein
MNLADTLAKTAPVKGPSSYLDRFLATLDDTDRAQVTEALRNHAIEANHLARALTDEARKAGFLGESNEISGASVRKWRANR